MSSQKRLVGSSRDQNLWPTTEELETAQSDIDRYERIANHALEMEETSVPDSPMLRSSGPALPSGSPSGDPLHGLLDGTPSQGETFTAENLRQIEDYSDESIQRAGAGPQMVQSSDPVAIANSAASSAPAKSGSQPLANRVPPVIAPIPPTRPGSQGGSVIGSIVEGPPPSVRPPINKPKPGPQQPHALKPPSEPDVTLLNADSAPSAEAFKGVSMLNEQRLSQGGSSVLDRRSKWKLSDVPAADPGGNSPLLDPSLGTPSGAPTLKKPPVFVE